MQTLDDDEIVENFRSIYKQASNVIFEKMLKLNTILYRRRRKPI